MLSAWKGGSGRVIVVCSVPPPLLPPSETTTRRRGEEKHPASPSQEGEAGKKEDKGKRQSTTLCFEKC